ncbi:hypothetical protein ACSFA3_14640 [Variovorax sp. RHLX14]|uniref:hypothetical protein n=1 Tax=Variovorax sp. RHLX14 TaxID=1259731 RepID=UPI003F44A668
MNTQWNTPPDGDFASYVERLSAKSARARRMSQADGEHSLDGGPTQSPVTARSSYSTDADDAGATTVPPWRRAGQRLPVKPLVSITPGSSPVPFKIAKIAAVAWVLVLVALIGSGAAFGLVVAVVFAGIWAAKGLRNWAMPQGHTSWSAWLRSQTTNR